MIPAAVSISPRHWPPGVRSPSRALSPALMAVRSGAAPRTAAFPALERDAAEALAPLDREVVLRAALPALPERARWLVGLGALSLAGLMTIGRLSATPAEARATFRALRSLAADLRTNEPALGAELSMGMSDDYPVAVEEGATTVRVGRALFGERPAGLSPGQRLVAAGPGIGGG